MITGADMGNEALLYLPRFMDPELPTGLWWCRDAEDMQEVGVNAVCKALTATWGEVGRRAGFIHQFPYILLAVPPGADQEELARELTTRFALPIMIPRGEAFRGYPSLRALREAGGIKAQDRLLLEAEELPAPGLLNLAQVDCSRRESRPRVVSGFPELDAAIGGFAPGELSVWTGKRGEGKSTLLGQLLLEAVNQNHTVCAYSGELPKEQFKLGLLQQAAGPLHVRAREEPRSGRVFYHVDPGAAQAINGWWDKRIFLTDIQGRDAHDEGNILKLFEYAWRRYGCGVFLADNIMTASLRDEASLGFWRAQSSFTGRLSAFAKAKGVHVHLVAHPRKTQGRLEADDVGGSSDITNRADNVFKVERVPEEKAEEVGFSCGLTVLKNREFGAQRQVRLEFNQAARRYYRPGGSPSKRYSWEEAGRS